MVGKKGFLRVVEAMMAVLLIFGALLIISPGKENVKREDLTDILRSLLDEIAKNQELRLRITNYNLSKCEPPNNQNRCRGESPNKEALENISLFLEKNIKNSLFNYSVSICRIDNSPCVLANYPSFDTDIYSAERLITTTPTQDESPNIKKIKVFLWRRL